MASLPRSLSRYPHPLRVGPTKPSAMGHINGPSARTSTKIEQLVNLRHLPSLYKGVLLDQFGVLHDGIEPYPGAIAAVTSLAAAGMRVFIISNSSRRSDTALKNLERMGFPPHAFYGAITSGELTHQYLSTRPTPRWAALRRCIHITWGSRGAVSLEELGIEVTMDPDDADCIVAHGTEALGTQASGDAAKPASLEDLKDLLAVCTAKGGMPMIVANPDLVTVQGSELRTMPGTLAKWYAAMGGEVWLMGKPASVTYEAALGQLELSAGQVVAIGDSMEHDIAGAASAGVDTVLVAGGIHAASLAVGPPDRPDWDVASPDIQGKLDSLCREYGVFPTFTMPYFQ